MFTLLESPWESQKRLSWRRESDCSPLKWASAAGHMNQTLKVPFFLSRAPREYEQMDQREM